MQLTFYSFFSKYSVLDNYGLLAGLWSRLTRKLVPQVPDEGTFEFYIREQRRKKTGIHKAVERVEYLLTFPRQEDIIRNDLATSITSLVSRIISIGLDHEFVRRFDLLEIQRSCFSDLATEAAKRQQIGKESQLYQILDSVLDTVQKLRNRKGKTGTSMHLTALTQELVGYVKRCKGLIRLEQDLHNQDIWRELIAQYLQYDRQRSSLRRYFAEHTDLLALEIVEHTSQKGEGYIAESAAEYRKFFRKGVVGGALIACFALFKIYLSRHMQGEISSAFMYSVNYASCFVLVKLVGGTIATKQPSMTASTITKYIDKDNDLVIDDIDSVVALLRRVSRSQFVSLMGNFLTALVVAVAVGATLKYGFDSSLITTDKAGKLIDSVRPIAGGGIAYAAVAGVFLATSGFVSGYFDNKVVASNLPHRLLHHTTMQKLTSERFRLQLGKWTKKNLGTIAGNVSLGFMLGMAWLLTYVLPFSVDIRHIAFSSSNVGYAAINGLMDPMLIAKSAIFVLLIGLVNFVVSFAITFTLALKSRSMPLRSLGKVLLATLLDFFKNPIAYFLYREVPAAETITEDKVDAAL